MNPEIMDHAHTEENSNLIGKHSHLTPIRGEVKGFKAGDKLAISTR